MASDARERAKATGDTIGSSINDAWIHAKITSKLIGDTATPARKINIDVVNGVVTLRGEVNTTAAKAEAERIAKDTEGVTRVKNILRVTAG
jgi:osmotically-inducible protein OsmY